MLARSIFASYYRLLTGAALAFAVFALTGCNEKAAEKVTPGVRFWSPPSITRPKPPSAVLSAR